MNTKQEQINNLVMERLALQDFVEKVARTACLDQRLHDRCICLSCEAKKLIQED